jgi:hypothetical protein
MDSPTLLSLPREIRDEIWSYVLVPSSGLIRPRIHKAFQSSPQFTPRYLLHHFTPSETKHTSSLVRVISPSPSHKKKTSTTSLSIIHTNRQIYAETHDLFWNNATFYFPPEDTRFVVKFLKGIGQTASRQIQAISIRMPYLEQTLDFLPRALSSLSSRARHGKLKRVTLVWDESEFRDLIRGYGHNMGTVWAPAAGRRVTELLEALNCGGNCGSERTIRFPDTESRFFYLDMMVEDLHFAFGGKFFVGERLIWNDFVRIARADGSL